MTIEVIASTDEAAWEEAATVYAQLRADAGLPPAAPAGGYVAPPPLVHLREARHDELLRTARDLLSHGHYDFAVIAAQTACEVYVGQAIGELIRRHVRDPLREVIPSLVRGYGMTRGGNAPALWEALTGVKITEMPRWEDYKAHVTRRHRIVHEGLTVTEAQATDSLAAAEAFFSFVREKWEAAPPQSE
jgi:hypothetical protein